MSEPSLLAQWTYRSFINNPTPPSASPRRS